MNALPTQNTHVITKLVEVNLKVISQFESGLGRLDEDRYMLAPRPDQSAIGAHVRHVIEFFQALFTHLDAIYSEAINSRALNYDARRRNLSLETDPSIALTEFNNIKSKLTDLPKQDLELSLCSIIDPDALHPDMTMCEIKTTLQRELHYLMDHTIHHMALVKQIAEKYEVNLGEQFGLSHSTRAYVQART